MGIIVEGNGKYDPYTDKFIKNTTTDRIEVGADGSLHNLSISSSYGLYAKSLEELDECDYIDKSTKLYTKDEVITMFTELKNKLIDKSWNIDMYDDDLDFECCYLTDIDEVIQQKINNLQVNNS